jgi:pyruvate kinase
MVECTTAGEILPNKRVIFYEYTPKIDFVNSRDSRDLLWGIGNSVNTVMASYVKTADDMIALRRFLDDNGGRHVKIFAKCQTEEFLVNYTEISKNCDGVIIKPTKLKELTTDSEEYFTKIVSDFNYHGKPIIVAVDKSELDAQEDIQQYLEGYVYA